MSDSSDEEIIGAARRRPPAAPAAQQRPPAPVSSAAQTRLLSQSLVAAARKPPGSAAPRAAGAWIQPGPMNPSIPSAPVSGSVKRKAAAAHAKAPPARRKRAGSDDESDDDDDSDSDYGGSRRKPAPAAAAARRGRRVARDDDDDDDDEEEDEDVNSSGGSDEAESGSDSSSEELSEDEKYVSKPRKPQKKKGVAAAARDDDAAAARRVAAAFGGASAEHERDAVDNDDDDDSDVVVGGRASRLQARVRAQPASSSRRHGGSDSEETDAPGGDAVGSSDEAERARREVGHVLQLLEAAPSHKKRFLRMWRLATAIHASLMTAASAGAPAPLPASSGAADSLMPLDDAAAAEGGASSSSSSASSSSSSSSASPDSAAMDSLIVTAARLAQVCGWALTDGGSGSGSSSSSGSEGPRGLKPFQLVGVNFLHLLRAQGHGCILADEMGLGKTVQVATFLGYIQHTNVPAPPTAAELRERARMQQQQPAGSAAPAPPPPSYLSAGPHLVVAPASIISNWQRELATWAPHLRVGVYRGGVARFANQRALQVGPLPGTAQSKQARGGGGSGSGGASGSREPLVLSSSDSEAGAAASELSGGDEEEGEGGKGGEEEEEEEEEGGEDDDDASDDGRDGLGATGAKGDGPPRAFDVLLVTYQLFDKQSTGANSDRAFLRRYRWDTLVLDEGHAIRDESRNRYRYLRALKARTRILLSGTPIQNTVKELFALLRFIMPSVFKHGTQQVFEDAVGHAAAASAAAGGAPRGAAAKRGAPAAGAALRDAPGSSHRQAQPPLDQALIAQLRSVLTPFMLRRSKTQVLGSLPPKTDSVVLVGATPAQAGVYGKLISDARARLVGDAPVGQTRALIGSGAGAAAAVDGDAALAAALAEADAPAPRSRRQAAVRAEEGITAGNAFFGASVAATSARATAAADKKQAGGKAAAATATSASGSGKPPAARAAGGSASAPAATGGGGALSEHFSAPQRRASADANAPARRGHASAAASPAARVPPAAASRAAACIVDSPFDVETTPGRPRGGPTSGVRGVDASGAAIVLDDDIDADTPGAVAAAPAAAAAAGDAASGATTAGRPPVHPPSAVGGHAAQADGRPRTAGEPMRRLAIAQTLTPFTEERTAGAVAEPGSSALPLGGSATSPPRLLDMGSIPPRLDMGGSGGGGGLEEEGAAGQPRVAEGTAAPRADAGVADEHATAPARVAAAAAAPPAAPAPQPHSVDPAAAARLASAVAKAPKRAVGNIFFDLRKAASHPLLLRCRYVHEPTLRRIAGALMAAGAFGNAKSLTLDKALAELRGSSDLEIHSMCAHYGSGRYEMADDLLDGAAPPDAGGDGAAGAAAAAVTPEVTAPVGLSGAALLHACRLPLSSVLGSAKAVWLAQQLPALLAGGHRVLIFSMWTSVLDILEVLLGQALNVAYLRLDGSTKVDERQALIDAFNAPAAAGAPSVFLLSTKAGGLGINLTSADTVIVHDLSFNPQDDAQAVDRAHRLGQTRPVRVLRLVTQATVDEGVYRLAAGKTALDVALKGGAGGGGGGGDELPAASIGELLTKALC